MLTHTLKWACSWAVLFTSANKCHIWASLLLGVYDLISQMQGYQQENKNCAFVVSMLLGVYDLISQMRGYQQENKNCAFVVSMLLGVYDLISQMRGYQQENKNCIFTVYIKFHATVVPYSIYLVYMNWHLGVQKVNRHQGAYKTLYCLDSVQGPRRHF